MELAANWDGRKDVVLKGNVTNPLDSTVAQLHLAITQLLRLRFGLARTRRLLLLLELLLLLAPDVSTRIE